MKIHKTAHDTPCSDIEKKRREFDVAYCDATYDSKQGRDRCYMEAEEANAKRADACTHP